MQPMRLDNYPMWQPGMKYLKLPFESDLYRFLYKETFRWIGVNVLSGKY